MERYVCIHGHFYQPPRENPWLESVEVQDPAYPYHDWNERVTAECYAPNAASRIQDDQGRITQIVNNYSRISFDFGPTLLRWMESQAPATYEAVLEADKESQGRFSGHGSAISQPYNHLIMPLASSRDKRTQVLWGVRDFERRFGRSPEGMWLPETAVDLETLDIMAEAGIRFTILAPHQALRVRQIDSGDWEDVKGGRIDPTRAYHVRLASGRSLAVFFYDEAIARAVAFEGLLRNGAAFAERLAGAFSDARPWPQLVHIATDGETYGHHHRFGDMALAFALHSVESRGLAHITNYGEFLERHPPTHEVEVIENTSWSCVHGVERWRRGCGCTTGQHPGWNQEWRAPLRQAVDWLRDTLSPRYEEAARRYLRDPWMARDNYIEVVLDRSQQTVERFLARRALRALGEEERVTVLKLLEMERNAMLMHTSCGWFFEDISGAETEQVILYAARTAQLAQELFSGEFESSLKEMLQRAHSNRAERGDGRQIYERLVEASAADLRRVAAHYAISSLYEGDRGGATIHSFTVTPEDFRRFDAGQARLAMGRARVESMVTSESGLWTFGFLCLGDHNVNGGVCEYKGEGPYLAMVEEVSRAFSRADFPDTIRLLDRCFGASAYSFRSLFRDERRRVLEGILTSTLTDIEEEYRQLYQYHYALMRFVASIGQPLPKAFQAAVEFILNMDLRREVGQQSPDLERINGLLREAGEWGIHLDQEGLGYELTGTLNRMMGSLASSPADRSLLEMMLRTVTLARSSGFPLNLWRVQNVYYEMAQSVLPRVKALAEQGDPGAEKWVCQFMSLGEQLSIRLS